MIFLHEKLVDRFGELRDNGFWEVSGNYIPEVGEQITLENYRGGHHFHYVTLEDEFIDSTWDKAMKFYTTEISDEKYGWIDRDGVFYKCGHAEHSFIIEACFGLSEIEAEEEGFVKIFLDPFELSNRNWFCKRRITQRQYDKLIELGFDNIRESKIE